MREYPRSPAFDSVSERRVNALAQFGFAQRQRQFLVTVMVHSGCFLERQYCAFTGTIRGQNTESSLRASSRVDSRVPWCQDPSDEGACTTSTTSRCTKRSGFRTTAIAVCTRSAGWSRGS